MSALAPRLVRSERHPEKITLSSPLHSTGFFTLVPQVHEGSLSTKVLLTYPDLGISKHMVARVRKNIQPDGSVIYRAKYLGGYRKQDFPVVGEATDWCLVQVAAALNLEIVPKAYFTKFGGVVIYFRAQELKT